MYCCVHCKCELDRWQGTWTIIFLTIQGIWDRFKVFIFCRTFSTDGWITLRDQIIPRIVVNWPCCDLSFWVRGWVLGPGSVLRSAPLSTDTSPAWELSAELVSREHICEQTFSWSEQKINNNQTIKMCLKGYFYINKICYICRCSSCSQYRLSLWLVRPETRNV